MTNSRTWSASEVTAICRDLARGKHVDPVLVGFPATACRTLKGLGLRGADLDHSDWNNVWIEGSSFTACSFREAKMVAVKDHGNSFTDCLFTRTRFTHAALGYEGTRFVRCRFENADFTGAVFVRGVFEDCDFVNCRLNRADFEASRFVGTRFTGRLKSVWFRGDFSNDVFRQRFGPAAGEPVLRASFEHAVLDDVTFSDGLDLSRVILPSAHGYYLFDRWPERLAMFEASLEGVEGPDLGEYQLFLTAYAPRGQTQVIVSHANLVKLFGERRAAFILAGLGAPAKASRP